MHVAANLSSPSLYTLYKYGCLSASRRTAQSIFYLSFEDALWETLEQRQLKIKSILLPSFFCTDVSSRLTERGIDVSFYSLDNNLQFIKDNFIQEIASKEFGAIILYYPLGMRAYAPTPQWLRKQLGQDTLIIEDLADCLTEEDNISLMDCNHIVIDSIRKLLPIQGARIWTQDPPQYRPSMEAGWYKFRTLLLWNLYRFLGGLFSITGFPWMDNIRWRIFSSHSDLIGTCKKSARGFAFDKFLLNFINIEAYTLTRSKVIQLYREAFASCPFPAPFGLVTIDPADTKNVRFPVFRGPKDSLTQLSEILEQKGISCDTHFNDSPLGMQYDFLLLPSAFHMTQQTVTMIAQTCFDYSASYTSKAR